MSLGLTPRQKSLLDFLRAYIEENGYSPSYDEMKAGIGLASKSGINRLMVALHERGHIEMPQNRRYRGISILNADNQPRITADD